jgi:hypothetical protein
MLFLNFPQALQTAEQVAAPQQEAPRDNNILALGIAMSGRDKRAPILEVLNSIVMIAIKCS